MGSSEPVWLRRLVRGGRPLYLALADALEGAIRDGELAPGDQLPPQRTVAGLLDVDLTTVTRAYAAARIRGLLEGAVGRGTYVRKGALEDDAGLIDLSMNLPPPPDGVSLAAMISETVAAILARSDAAALMAYHPGAGTLGQRMAGAAWTAPSLGDVAPERVLIAPGAQAGLTALLMTAAASGVKTIVVEPLTYPGLLTLARHLGLKRVVCPVDDQGFEPEALARLCAQERPAAVYVVPTTQNPTARTMGLARRREVAQAVRAADGWIIEDDPYSRLFDDPIPALASLAPDRTFYLATVSKCLSPGLRTAFLVTPPGAVAGQVAASLRAVALMASPLMTAVVTTWIREGAAEACLAGVKREARARRAVAAEILPTAKGAGEGVHVWLDLPQSWEADRVRLMAQQRGLALVTADAFATGPTWPNGLRISLGGPTSRVMLRSALENVAALLTSAPPTPRIVV